jgi:hypothetical protein
MRRLFVVVLALAALACSPQPLGPDARANPGDGETIVVGPALFIKVEGTTARVFAKDLGPAFGVAYHLVFDAELSVDGDPASSQRAFLDSTGKSAAYFARQKPGRLLLGGSLTRAEQTDVELTGEVELGAFTFHGSAGKHPLTLDRVVVRRSDGSFVATAAHGATLEAQP